MLLLVGLNLYVLTNSAKIIAPSSVNLIYYVTSSLRPSEVEKLLQRMTQRHVDDDVGDG